MKLFNYLIVICSIILSISCESTSSVKANQKVLEEGFYELKNQDLLNSDTLCMLKGRIFDARTKDLISFGRVFSLNDSLEIYIDSSGFFGKVMQPGIYNLKISSVGFVDLSINEVKLKGGNEVFIEAYLGSNIDF